MSHLARLFSSLRFQVPVLAFVVAAVTTHAGWSFDTLLSPEATRDLLAAPGFPAPPAGSWLRLRDMPRSMVRDESGMEIPPWPAATPSVSLAERRAALAALRERGYRLIGFVRWPSNSWAGGVRPDQPLRRLPLDLREATARCRQLAGSYGDLIDYWEIENEPDISFVEENPETYAAFLKAGYLGFAQGRPETRDRRPEKMAATNPADATRLPFQVSGLRSQVSPAATGRVLAAAFALPPGPYFDAWVANDGLRYTDGFNYHYYGYAEDFTGVYHQFQAAVEHAPEPAPAGVSVFQTRFYPSPDAWQTKVLSSFSPVEGAGQASRESLQARPLAREEPVLGAQGRWLVSPGTTVRETDGGWEFAINTPLPGPLRPAMAELPLPDGWTFSANTSFAMQYRADASRGKGQEERGQRFESAPPDILRPSPAISYPPSVPMPPASSRLPVTSERKLPVFLTEYGYGLLGRESRLTATGRDEQRRWFEAILPQLHSLGIQGAMAFVLPPYLEADNNEFGLLMDAGRGAVTNGGQPVTEPGETQAVAALHWGKYVPSPALQALLQAGAEGTAPRDWTVAVHPPTSVVIDFVADSGLTMAKGRRGYLLQSESAGGRLILYNLSDQAITGELSLRDSAWTLMDGTRSFRLQLRPNERLEVSVKVDLAGAARLGAHVAEATFAQKAVPTDQLARAPVAPSAPESARKDAGVPVVSPPPVSDLSREVSPFEVYLRTANGNLYQTWPRLMARDSWQWYVESFDNFTPAFFGRAFLPAALAENQPVALVFFFRPDRYPTTYQIRHASVVGFERRPAPALPAAK